MATGRPRIPWIVYPRSDSNETTNLRTFCQFSICGLQATPGRSRTMVQPTSELSVHCSMRLGLALCYVKTGLIFLFLFHRLVRKYRRLKESCTREVFHLQFHEILKSVPYKVSTRFPSCRDELFCTASWFQRLTTVGTWGLAVCDRQLYCCGAFKAGRCFEDIYSFD